MSNTVIDIIERFQTRHALQEEREMKNFNASRNGAPTQGVPFQAARNGHVPHDGRDRMVVTLGRIRQLPRDSDSAFPARWACIPANSDFKVPNENHHTRNFLIVEFNDANDQKLSAENREK